MITTGSWATRCEVDEQEVGDSSAQWRSSTTWSWTKRSRPRERLREALEEVTTSLLRRQLPRLRKVREDPAETGDDVRELGGVVANGLPEVVEARRLRETAFDDLRERQIGKRLVALVAVPDKHSEPTARGVVGHLHRETRLAHARSAGEHHQRPRPRGHGRWRYESWYVPVPVRRTACVRRGKARRRAPRPGVPGAFRRLALVRRPTPRPSGKIPTRSGRRGRARTSRMRPSGCSATARPRARRRSARCARSRPGSSS
jgi:hypothetical protein